VTLGADADLMLEHGVVVTMDPHRRVFADGAIVVRAGAIVDVGPSATVDQRWTAANRLDLEGNVLLPGLVNAHVHLTGLDLFPGLEPADSPVADHLANWALPAHAYATPEDERATARFLSLQMLTQGVTAFIEAGTIRFPDAVLDGLADLRLRGSIGTWTWDRWTQPARTSSGKRRQIRPERATATGRSTCRRARTTATTIGRLPAATR
jgi:cytosine/adenosine deaminase-related metal-dependent hydrolase